MNVIEISMLAEWCVGVYPAMQKTRSFSKRKYLKMGEEERDKEQ